MRPLELRCPACGRALNPAAAGALACAPCERTFASRRGVLDLRLEPAQPTGWPAGAAALKRALDRLERGLPYKAALEELLLELDDDDADRSMQLLRESRGAWAPLCRAPAGRALVLGNALTGTAVALARCGFEVTLLEADELRLAFALQRAQALAPDTTRSLAGGDRSRLPFGAGVFDLVVLEQGLPAGSTAASQQLAECRRVASGELALIVQNRLAYKTNDLRRGRFHVPSPLQFAARVLRPRGGERTLAAARRLAGGGARAFALYPHSDDYSQIVGLDGDRPSLDIGPKERENRWKVAAHGAGLFPHLAPSYLVIGSSASGPTRLERVLAALSERTGEPRPRLDQLVATRGLSSMALTSCPDALPEDPRGRWCIHVPLCPSQADQVARHARQLTLLSQRFPSVPVPELLFVGELEGLWLTCERRLGGLTAPQLTGEQPAAARMFADAARDLAALVVEERFTCDEPGFERLLGQRFARVERHARVESTLVHLGRLRERARQALLGRTFPLVLTHQDLRSKHVQVEPDGAVVGYLDWGTADERGLPFLDLFHLIVHERKHEAGLGAGAAWRIARERAELREHERRALDSYGAALGLDAEFRSLVEELYPVLVAAMAEEHWDYSRPRWLHRQFGI